MGSLLLIMYKRLYQKYILMSCCCILSLCFATAQEQKKTASTYYTIDSNGELVVHLQTIEISPHKSNIKKTPRRYRQGTRAYNRTIRNLKVVYPLAKATSKKINEIDRHLLTIKDKKARERYIKEEYRKLMKKYKEPMKNLKISQGRMLLLLIDRETGHTSYEHIKEFKGGFMATFWQGVAKIFGNNLKTKYDPYGKHHYIEYLIFQYENGLL